MSGTKASNIPPPEWDLLLSAAQKNRPDLILEMIEKAGVNPSHANSVGQSALHIASLWGHVEAVRTLVRLGANVNAQNNLTGATPLHMIVQSNKVKTWEDRIQVINILVEGGADVEQGDRFGNYPADSLAMSSNDYSDTQIGELKKLLTVQEEPIVIPPIFVALTESNTSIETIQSVLQADPTTSNAEYEGNTTIIYVVNEIYARVTDSASNNTDSSTEVSKLAAILELLVEHGGNPNIIPKKKKKKKSNPYIPFDESDESDVDSTLPLQKSVLSLRECYKKELSCTKYIESSVVCLHDKGSAAIIPETEQLLYQVARFGEIQMVQFLISVLHINPNTVGPQCMTPLHFAARSGQLDVVKFLLQQPGIDVSLPDNRGKTALDAAKINDKVDIVIEIEKYISSNTSN